MSFKRTSPPQAEVLWKGPSAFLFRKAAARRNGLPFHEMSFERTFVERLALASTLLGLNTCMLIREVTQPPDPAQRQIASLGDQVQRLRQQQQRLRAQRRIRQGRAALAKASAQ